MEGIERAIQKLLSKFKTVSLASIFLLLIHWIKKIRWILLLIVCLIILQLVRSRPRLVTLQGYAMNKSYSIQYWGKQVDNYQPAIDSLLLDLAQAIELDEKESEVKRFNQQNCQDFPLETPFIYHLLEKSKEVYNRTQGVFDPTIAPLADLWKKQLEDHIEPSKKEIDAILEYVSLDYVMVNRNRIKKLKDGVKIDIRGLVQGYEVDTVAGLLKNQGARDMLVKIGDEAIAYGKQAKNKEWQVSETFTAQQDTIAPITITINLVNKAIAVARKKEYWKETSDQSTLMINPQTGCPPHNNILAVIVLAQDCITADAYTTALMIKDLAFAQDLLKENRDIEAMLIYKDHTDQIDFYISDGLIMAKNLDAQSISLFLKP